jgi:hypothetical protein
MSGKFEKRLAAMLKQIADIEAHELATNGPTAPIRWGGGAPGMMDLFLSMPKRIAKTDDNELRLRYLVVMRLALAFFFDHLKKSPDSRRLLEQQKVAELVGIAQRYAPKFKEFAEFYKTHCLNDGKPDRAKMKESKCPILV